MNKLRRRDQRLVRNAGTFRLTRCNDAPWCCLQNGDCVQIPETDCINRGGHRVAFDDCRNCRSECCCLTDESAPTRLLVEIQGVTMYGWPPPPGRGGTGPPCGGSSLDCHNCTRFCVDPNGAWIVEQEFPGACHYSHITDPLGGGNGCCNGAILRIQVGIGCRTIFIPPNHEQRKFFCGVVVDTVTLVRGNNGCGFNCFSDCPCADGNDCAPGTGSIAGEVSQNVAGPIRCAGAIFNVPFNEPPENLRYCGSYGIDDTDIRGLRPGGCTVTFL